MSASVPEPNPIPEGKVVSNILINWISENGGEDSKACIELIRERDLFGRQKYGQPLMTKDGRNTIEDLRQEIGDALQYTMKAIENGEDLSPVLPHIRMLDKLITHGIL